LSTGSTSSSTFTFVPGGSLGEAAVSMALKPNLRDYAESMIISWKSTMASTIPSLVYPRVSPFLMLNQGEPTLIVDQTAASCKLLVKADASGP
jgi:hypothetical protein